MKFDLFYPVRPFTVIQPFGTNGEFYQKNGINIKGHNGLDLLATHGQPIRASHDGTAYPGVDAKEGYGVVVRTNEEFWYKDRWVYFKSIYWHLLSNIPVKMGQKVKAGDIIGYADNTGFSFGDHLHFGLKPQYPGEGETVWWNYEDANGYLGAIDPTPYFNKYYGDQAQFVLATLTSILELLKKVVFLLTKKNEFKAYLS